MRLSDKLFLHQLAKKHDIDRDLDDALRKANQLDNEDLRRLGQILTRLSDRELRFCAEHPRLPDVVERFAELSSLPRLQALAFYKLGVPIRGIVLPELIRERLAITVRENAGCLEVNGRPIHLRSINYAQTRVLRRVDVPAA